MKSPANRNFHLPLPNELYEKLKEEARRRGRPATAVARQALEDGLRERRRLELHEEIAEYARAHAGSSADLDLSLEEAGIQSLSKKRR